MSVDIHALAGAYALDAVDDLERAAFDRHLRDCASCAAEVAELRETAAWLTYPVAEAPPPRLREAVMAEIARTPQERSRRETVATGRASRNRLQRWGVAAVAAAVLAAGVGAGTWVVSQQRLNDLRTENAQVDAVLAASDARLVSTDMRGGRVTVVVSPSRAAAVAVLDGLPAPGDGKAYQLWMIGDDNAARNAGLVHSGTARVYVPFVAGTFGITVEPAGGSAQPTRSATVGTIPVAALDLQRVRVLSGSACLAGPCAVPRPLRGEAGWPHRVVAAAFRQVPVFLAVFVRCVSRPAPQPGLSGRRRTAAMPRPRRWP